MAQSGNTGLGKGRGALLRRPERDEVRQVRVSEIVPNRFQPRREFDESALEELRSSIEQYGVLQPILLRARLEGGYEVIAGERRLRAAKLAGKEAIPAIVRAMSDAEIGEAALVENLQREELNVMEEAIAYRRLLKEFSLTQEEIAKKVGRSRPHIANILGLLKLPDSVQDALQTGRLSMGQAKPLGRLKAQEMQIRAAEHIEREELSARAAEAYVSHLAMQAETSSSEAEEKPGADLHVRQEEERLARFFGTKVRIVNGKKAGKIQISFASLEEYERILEIFEGRGQQESGSAQPKAFTV